MIFTTCDASANSVAAIAKVALTRLSLGRSSSIDNFCGVKSTRRNRRTTAVFFVMRFDVAPMVIWIFELPLDQEIRAVRVIRILLGLATWLGSSRHHRRQKWIRSWRESACLPSTTQPVQESLSRSGLI